MLVDHDGALGGHLLRFLSPLDHLTPDLTLDYGRSLIDFTPRLSAPSARSSSVGAVVWVPPIKMRFAVTRRLGLGPMHS